MKTSEKIPHENISIISNHCIIIWNRFVPHFRSRISLKGTLSYVIQIKLKLIQAFELASSVQASLFPPWQAVEPQTAGMVRDYDEAR